MTEPNCGCKLKNMNLLRAGYLLVRDEIMARGKLQPRGVYRWSKSGKQFSKLPEPLQVPNIVGYYLPVLRAYWEYYGLGAKSLLVSESRKVANAMHGYYPQTEFTACDLFTELMGNEEGDRPHLVWDVCSNPPKDIKGGGFDSVICQALLEHVIAPTTALKNMAGLLNASGRLYFQTHTPSFHKHSVPRDYVRFQHDYFEDLPKHLLTEYGIKMDLIELHSTKGFICGVMSRSGE